MSSTLGACVLVCAAPLALANAPPPDPSVAPSVTTAPADTAPAITPATAEPAAPDTLVPTAQSDPGVSQAVDTTSAAARDAFIEKRLRAQGYRPEMRHGEKYFCRLTDTLGSRVMPVKACSTAEQLIMKQREAKEFVEWAQRTTTPCPTSCK